MLLLLLLLLLVSPLLHPRSLLAPLVEAIVLVDRLVYLREQPGLHSCRSGCWMLAAGCWMKG